MNGAARDRLTDCSERPSRRAAAVWLPISMIARKASTSSIDVLILSKFGIMYHSINELSRFRSRISCAKSVGPTPLIDSGVVASAQRAWLLPSEMVPLSRSQSDPSRVN